MSHIFSKSGPPSKVVSFAAQNASLLCNDITLGQLNFFTFQTWIRYGAGEEHGKFVLFAFEDGAFQVLIRDGRLTAEVNDDVAEATSFPLPGADGSRPWVHITVMISGYDRQPHVHFFVNGAVAGRSTLNEFPKGDGRFTVSSPDINGFRGEMAVLAVWDRVRSDEQIAADRLEIDPNSDGLLGLWVFEDDAQMAGAYGASAPSQLALVPKGTETVETNTLPDRTGLNIKMSQHLPIRGRNGARERFLAKARQVADKRIAEQHAIADAKLKAAQQARDRRLAAAHKEAIRQANNARFDEILHLRGGGISALQRNGTVFPLDGTGASLATFVPTHAAFESFCIDLADLTDALVTELANSGTPIYRIHWFQEQGREKVAVITCKSGPIGGNGHVARAQGLSSSIIKANALKNTTLVDIMICPGSDGPLAYHVLWDRPNVYPNLNGRLVFPFSDLGEAPYGGKAADTLATKLQTFPHPPCRIYGFTHDGKRKFIPLCLEGGNYRWDLTVERTNEDLSNPFPQTGGRDRYRILDFHSEIVEGQSRHALLFMDVRNEQAPAGQHLEIGDNWRQIRRAPGRPKSPKPVHITQHPSYATAAVASRMAIDPVNNLIYYAEPGVRPTLREMEARTGAHRQLSETDDVIAALDFDRFNRVVYLAFETGELSFLAIGHSGEPEHFSHTGMKARGNGWQIKADVPRRSDGTPIDRASIYFSNGHGIWRRHPSRADIECIVAPEDAPDVMGLTLDSEKRRIYWIDRTLKLVRSSGMDGEAIRNLYRAHMPGPGAMLDVVTADDKEIVEGLKQDIYWTERITDLSSEIPNLVAYWPCDDSLGDTLADKLDIGHHAQMCGPRWCDVETPLPLPRQPEQILEVSGPLEFDFRDSLSYRGMDFTLVTWFRAAHGMPEGLAVKMWEDTRSDPSRYGPEPTLTNQGRTFDPPEYAHLGWRQLALVGKMDGKKLNLQFFVNGSLRRDEFTFHGWPDDVTNLALEPVYDDSKLMLTAPYVLPKALAEDEVAALMREIGPTTTRPETEREASLVYSRKDTTGEMQLSDVAAIFGGAFTFTAWLYHDLSPHGPAILFAGENGVPTLWLNGNVLMFSFNSAGDVITSNVDLIESKVNHIAAVYNGAEVELFVNGAPAGRQNVAPLDPKHAGKINYTSNPFFEGRLYIPEVHARVFNHDEIQTAAHPKREIISLARRDFGATWADDAPPVLEPGARCLELRHRDHGFALPDLETLGLLASDMTVEFWFKPMAVVAKRTLMTIGHIVVRIVEDDLKMFTWENSDLKERMSWSMPLGQNVWRHIALRFGHTQNQWDVFVDGERVMPDHADAMGQFSGENKNVRFGDEPGKGAIGRIAEIRLWSEARTDAQIAAHQRSFNASYLMRAPADGTGRPEVVTEIATDGDLGLISRLSQAHEKHLLSVRANHEAMQQAAKLVSEAQTKAAQKKAKAHADLDTAHEDAQNKIAAKNAEQKQSKADNAAKVASARKDKSNKVAAANQGARQRQADAHDRADAQKADAHRDAASMKSAANQKLHNAKAEARKQR